jgi:hypothetical protein
VVDNEKVAKETAAYQPIPVITNLSMRKVKAIYRKEIEYNYRRIKDEVTQIIMDELARIKNNP